MMFPRSTMAMMAVVALTTTCHAFQATPLRSLSSSTTTTITSSSSLNIFSSSESMDRDIESLQGWAAANGIENHPAFGLDVIQEYEGITGAIDVSVVATQELPANSPFLKVPPQLILDSKQIEQEMSGTSVQAAVDQLSRLGAGEETAKYWLWIKVLTSAQMGDQSPWFPWLNSLPRLFYNAVSMTNFCYECLPPLVYRYARGERVKFDNFIDTLAKIDNSILSEETKKDTELLKWAFNVVYTRSQPRGDDPQQQVLIPMADLFNHGTETEVAIGYDDEGNCVAYTTQDVQAGSPLRISYGDPTNPSALFATYGFLDESSPATFCKITNIQPNDELRNLGFDPSRMLFFKETGDISEEVWDVMLYQVLNANKGDQQAFYQAHMSGDADTKSAIHQHYFAETGTALKKHVDDFLTSLDELSAKAEGKDLNEHPRLPLILKHNEFVKKTFLNVKANLDPMVEQAAVVEYA